MFRAIASLLTGLVCFAVLGLIAVPNQALGQNAIHIAFGDVPGEDMLNFLIAVKRAEARGVQTEISYLTSEDIASQAVVSGQADIGVGTPYALIQNAKAPIRMFFQISKLRFFPVVNTEKYKTWKDLDGAPMYVHSRGSGTEAIMNLMAKKHGIKYASISYLPGSSVRVGALLQGRIHASIVDAQRKAVLLQKGGSKFAVLPMPDLQGSDEALYANLNFLQKNRAAIDILMEELIKTWREINKNPAIAVELRNKMNLLPDMDKDDVGKIMPYYTESVATGTFSDNGGGKAAVNEDFEFYGFAGTLKGDPSQLKVEDFWYLEPLDRALAKLGRM
jgi:NitT/TauT family transport system substrate-binding protein